MSHVVEDQSEIVRFLERPDSYPEGVGPESVGPESVGPESVGEVERVDTHGAMVFLAGERAYKVKRAVSFPYMDFSTLERRRKMTERELELNRRTAPDLYLRVLPLTRGPDGGLAFDGPGETVEWVLEMRRFESDGLFDRLAAREELGDGLLTGLADEVAAFHEAAERFGPETGFGGAEAILGVIAENAQEFPEHPRLFPEGDALTRASREALAGVAELLDRRAATGAVRHCHGDLHLRNICRWRSRPLIFDCIEFNDAIAVIDVLYDLAFLLMDLEHRDLRRAANLVLNRYLQRRDELEGLAALPLFLSLRAAIRAKVTASVADTQEPGEARERLEETARGYVPMARAFLEPAPARLVAVSGLSGSGKSLLARELAPFLGAAPGAVVLRSDVIRKHLLGVEEGTRLPSSAYTREANEQVYAELHRRAARALAAGRAVVADAVFAREEERAAIAEVAAARGVPFDGLWLSARPETLVERIGERKGDASDATVEVVRRQLDYDLGEISWHRVDAEARPEEVLTEARGLIGVAQ